MEQTQRDARLAEAHALYGAGKLAEAEALYDQVRAADPDNSDALHSLFAIYMKTDRPEPAVACLKRLASLFPEDPRYTTACANALAERGEMDAALACYEEFLARRPAHADSSYNYARLLNAAGRHEDALAEYRQALDQGIGQAEAVHTNMSVILSTLHRHDEARASLDRALSLNPRYVPALYNLGLMHEEYGRPAEARKLFKRILRSDPHHAETLARLAHGRASGEPANSMLFRLQRALDAHQDDTSRESLLYALGRVYDDCQRFDEAFEAYAAANGLSRHRAGRWDRDAHDALTTRLIDFVDQARELAPVSDAPLVFICGMFRSGSTLLEQMLGAHPALIAAGEITFIREQLPLPAALELPPARLRNAGLDYLDYLGRTFAGQGRVIDKQPENFLYVGLLCRLFPNARFLNTCRQPFDNCISIYFQQLTEHFSYANELMDIAHYYLKYRELMAGWRQRFADNIIDVHYEQLVRNPEPVLRTLLESLQLAWDPRCLDYAANPSRVRTASVSQVRQPLADSPTARWQDYLGPLQELREYLLANDIAG